MTDRKKLLDGLTRWERLTYRLATWWLESPRVQRLGEFLRARAAKHGG